MASGLNASQYDDMSGRKDVPLITAVCEAEQHVHCSTRIRTNPSEDWRRASYVPCECECHRCPVNAYAEKVTA